MIKDYRIGVVICRCGLTDHQMREFTQHVRETSKLVEGLRLMVPGFTLEKAEESIDPGVKQVAGRYEKNVTLEVGAFSREPNSEAIMTWLRDCDELLGFPAKMGQRLKANRVWSLYRRYTYPLPLIPAMKIIAPWEKEHNGATTYIGKRDK